LSLGFSMPYSTRQQRALALLVAGGEFDLAPNVIKP
jgi:hypothetical protein